MKKLLLFISACLAAFSISNAATTILEEGKEVSITAATAWGGWYGALGKHSYYS